MKKLGFVFGCFSLCVLYGADIREENVFLLSFPASGNTWTRYCIEFITKRPTGESPYLFPIQKERSYMNCPLNNTFPLGVDYDAPPVIKIHDITERFPVGENDYLLVIVRDYKEAFSRNQEPQDHENFEKTLAYLKKPGNRYFRVLQTYHDWPKDRKLLVYYEDLMQFPEETFYKLADFFQVSHEYIPLLLQDYKWHKRNSMTIYERDQSQCMSQGKDVHFHAKKFSSEELHLLDSTCEQLIPELFHAYLTRYKEVEQSPCNGVIFSVPTTQDSDRLPPKRWAHTDPEGLFLGGHTRSIRSNGAYFWCPVLSR